MWLLWLGLAVLQEGAAERLEPRLAAVETSRAAPAEIRALARALKPGDAPWLAARAERLSPLAEVGLLQALGWDESQLGLCVALTRAANGRARALGEQALRSQLLAFVPASVRRMDEPEEILAALEPRGRWRLSGDGSDLVEHLHSALSVSLDAGLRLRPLPCSAAWEGELGEAALDCARALDAELVGCGHARGAEHAAWLALLPRAADRPEDRPEDPRALLRQWIDRLELETAHEEREQHWLALTGTRWTAALLWAEQAAERGDAAARAALVQLCARGQVVPLCFQPRFTAQLCTDFLQAKDPQVARAAAGALAGIGPLDAEGGDTLARLWASPLPKTLLHKGLLVQILRAHAAAGAEAQGRLRELWQQELDPALRLLIADQLPETRIEWSALVRWADSPERRARLQSVVLRWPRLEWPAEADPMLLPRLALRSAGRASLLEALGQVSWSDAERDAWLANLSGMEREELRAVLGTPEPAQAPAREWPGSPGALLLDAAWLERPIR